MLIKSITCHNMAIQWHYFDNSIAEIQVHVSLHGDTFEAVNVENIILLIFKIYSISTNVVHYTMISLPLTLVYCMSRPSKFLDIIFVFLEVSTDKIRNCNCHKIVRGQIGNQILLIEFLWRKLCSFLSVCKRYLYSFLKYQVTKVTVVQ